MVSNPERVETAPKKIVSSYLFINPFLTSSEDETAAELLYMGSTCGGEKICIVNDPLIYCTAKELSRFRYNIDEITSYYLVCVASIPHLPVEWYQLKPQIENDIGFFSFTADLISSQTGKEVVSCGIIPMFSNEGDVGYLHYYLTNNDQKFAFIYRGDAIDTISEIINQFKLSSNEIQSIVELQDSANKLPKYFKPQMSQGIYDF